MVRMKMEATQHQHTPSETLHDAPPPPAPQAFPPPEEDVHSFPPQEDLKPPPQQFPPPPDDETLHSFPPQGKPPPSPPPPLVGQLFAPPPPQPNLFGVVQAGISPFPLNLQQTQLQPQPWKTHIFGCFDNPLNAIITLICPCITFGQIAEIVESGSTSCGSSGMAYCLIACCFGVPCLMSCGYRSKLRSRFRLVESPAPDCLVHCFCEYCALCQEYRELQQRGFDPSLGWSGNVAQQQQKQKLQQFVTTPPMQQRMI